MPRRTLELTRVIFNFAYGAITLFRRLSQVVQLSNTYPMSWSVTPILRLVWAPPLSLAATYGIDFLSFPLINGSKLISSSPSLFAGNRVLHRLLMPRHPLYALINLTS